MKNIGETRNYFIEETHQNELMSKKFCTASHYIEHLLILATAVAGWVSISAFASLVGILIEITSSVAESKICAVNVRINNYKSIIKKRKKKYDKIVLLAKTKLYSIEFLVSNALIYSYIHNELASVDLLREYDDIRNQKP